ncbi:uncharacterized protein VTP21DRAFT_2155 [Calcarisporiella thermophila]|uniref:uncharacterized protein n=1 Tax=Calcarisporiella thermophila TaxID=911321 RepID=UPI0037421033
MEQQKEPTKFTDYDTFFKTHHPPPRLAECENVVREFVKKHLKTDRRVVLVTSGGTTVPLERQTVRFVDNFSNGTRGATSAEYFLENGYAVIFMHRQFSNQPYSRHYSHTTNCFLDYLEIQGGANIGVDPQYVSSMKSVLAKYRAAKDEGLLLMIEFVTVSDYLFLLRSTAKCMSKLGERAMYYLAAAVSDFFIPEEKMALHKIQSGDGALTLHMEQVPKMLKPLVDDWAKNGFVVSFKLETDPNLLIPKARNSLHRYGHQIVVGNLLTTRKACVWLVTRDGQSEFRLTEDEINHGVEIESRIIPELIQRHEKWIRAVRSKL